eukprot:CAMPEP_0178826458 /NCGR_PEP_ID=MMETSP0746-20121128/6759_1 /TAXON_ID=913974 /ORGANISM="Nitzschia punctata, Strain CCMP561" /LENGTH=271 /DNA_ID=CAMNT_0020488277 /DNA_START=57 /DNA_END=872 /DNA_ORIENTATION=+
MPPHLPSTSDVESTHGSVQGSLTHESVFSRRSGGTSGSRGTSNSKKTASSIGPAEDLVKLIISEDWIEADTEAHMMEKSAFRKEFNVLGFYDGDIDAKVLCHHLACRKTTLPVFFVETLRDLNPQGFTYPESTYKRLPLHIACMDGISSETIMALISGCRNSQLQIMIKRKDGLGRLPIHYALKHKHLLDVAKYLLKAFPASAKTADQSGFLPLHIACRFGMPASFIRELIQLFPGAVHAQTAKGTTPLMYAAVIKDRENMKQVVALLNDK